MPIIWIFLTKKFAPTPTTFKFSYLVIILPECFISTYEDKEGYMQRGIGEENSKAEAKKAAAFDMLQFIFDER